MKLEKFREIQRYLQGRSDFCSRHRDSQMLVRADYAIEQFCDLYEASINMQPEQTPESEALWMAIGAIHDKGMCDRCSDPNNANASGVCPACGGDIWDGSSADAGQEESDEVS